MDSTQTVTIEVTRQINTALMAVGMTRHRLATDTGIPSTTLQRKLKGDGEFTLNELLRVARALNVAPSALLPSDFKVAA